MKEYARGFYKSAAWKHCRAEYAKSVGLLCERCRERGEIVPGKIVHHKKPITPANIGDESITLNPANLELLCAECHNREHMRKKKERRYTVDQYGNVLIYED